MMTAVAITLIMLAASGMIFNSASKSSGKAMALNNMMQEARVIISQLESDFAGYRDDLPFTVLFEGYSFGIDSNLDGVSESSYLERCDRISFFTNGDFEDIDGYKSLMSRVLYSQTENIYTNLNTDGINPTEYSGIAPDQRMLCRKMKMMTTVKSYGTYFIEPLNPSDPSYSGVGHTADINSNWLDYEKQPLEYGPEYLWKSADAVSYLGWWLHDYGLTSFIRRPNYPAFYADSLSSLGNSIDAYAAMNNYKQKNCMVSDCTDFTIQIWIKPPGENLYRWFPTNWDMLSLTDNTVGSYWRVTGNIQPTNSLGISWNISKNISSPPIYGTYNGNSKRIFPNYMFPTQLEKPKAYKFSFKLYDKNRTHYPEGKMFSYIIDVRDKD